METPNLENAIAKIMARHDIFVNQKYDESSLIPIPYSKHLEAVAAQAMKFYKCFEALPAFSKIFPEKLSPAVTQHSAILLEHILITAWGHDLIEDARMSFNDVKKQFGIIPAKAILAMTEFPGETREERHPKQYWDNILANPLAAYVKLCDIIANVSWGLLFGSSMSKKYKTEWHHRKNSFRVAYPQFADMYETLETLFELVD